MKLVELEGLEIELVRKRIRNLSIRVMPPDGTVKASVPLGMSIKQVNDFIQKKEPWIRQQKAKIANNAFTNVAEYTIGEEHYLFGKPYNFDLRETSGKEGVALEEQTIVMYCKAGRDREQKEKLMERWSRENLLTNLPGLVSKWEERMGLDVKEFRVRKMTTRWGTCNPRARRIWFSLMLAKRRPELIEYIVVHEMVHFLVQGHNKLFYNYMDKYLSDWKNLRKELR
ncbi:MAG: SprT family zinc-dependent metalloprotease [Bacteroidales bacterium]|nr:SprT family zinc-dependent metalloprotease [Bacteroidales bacterium]